jgi:phenylpropionate dioxygenase-like ring-hydroxylating dioxygenase large terminal subunit
VGRVHLHQFRPDAKPLDDYLGSLAKGIEGYPFRETTEVYSYRADVGSNWKLFIDAFAEFYHAPVLHQKQYTAEEAAKIQKYGFEALYYELSGPHAIIPTWGGQSPPADLKMVNPAPAGRDTRRDRGCRGDPAGRS